MRTNVLSSTCHSLATLLLVSLLHIQVAQSATADQWRSRSIYQVVTDRFAQSDGSTTAECIVEDKKYCGGTFQGIINKLDYIAGMGFTAIWISPVIKGIEDSPGGSGYHGFWQQDLNTINPHFGTKDDLKALSKAVHDKGMYLMVDILINNFAYPGGQAAVDYSKFSAPFNQASAFHKYCAIGNYSDPTQAQNCWLAGEVVSLPDVNTESGEIQQYFSKYAKDLATEYEIDGYRVDAAKHVPKAFWNRLQSDVGIYMMGEFFDLDNADIVCNTIIQGLDGVLNFPLYQGIQRIFGNAQAAAGDMQWYLYNLTNNCRDTTLLGTFTENHDVDRFGTWTDDAAVRANALAFAMTNDGIPTVYYGSEQGFSGRGDPNNREALWPSGYKTDGVLYKTIKAINYARNKMVDASLTDKDFSPYWKFKSKPTYLSNDIVAIRKGYSSSMVAVMSNKGSKSRSLGPYRIADTNFGEDVEITDVINCQKQRTYEYGTFTTSLTNGMPQVWIPSNYLGSDFRAVCPSVKSVSHPKIKSDAPGLSTSSPMVWSAWFALALASVMFVTN